MVNPVGVSGLGVGLENGAPDIFSKATLKRNKLFFGARWRAQRLTDSIHSVLITVTSTTETTMAPIFTMQTCALLVLAIFGLLAVMASAEAGAGRKLMEYMTTQDGYIMADNGDIAITSVRSSGN